MEALAVQAADLPEHGGLPLRFDPLRDHLDLEAVGEVDDGSRDPGLRIRAVDPVDERLRDLQPVEREALQVLQLRVPGAEVVDRELHPQLLERVEPFRVAAADLHQDRLGDLQGEAAGLQSGGL